MKEAFLHYIWKNKVFDHDHLFLEDGKKVEVIFPGYHNADSGPDFLEAKIRIDDILWVGNIEIHLKSSDWYVHGHEQDPAYDNIILHVVYDHDMPVYSGKNTLVPTVVIAKLIEKKVLKKYNSLIKNKSILKCQNRIGEIEPFLIFQYKYKLYFERLEEKNSIFNRLLRESKNNWEQVLYEQLLKYFGGTVNKEAFGDLSKYLPFEIFKKYIDNIQQLEALLMGVSGLLTADNKNCTYYHRLKNEFDFLSHKHNLKVLKEGSVRFHRMRPRGFPTLRLAQFAMLYHSYNNLFDTFMQLNTPQEAYEIFEVSASEFWDTHYNFEKTTKAIKKKMSKSFIDRMLINVLIPLKFAFFKNNSDFDSDSLIHFIEAIKPEKNRIVDLFTKIGIKTHSALDTQAMVQLYNKYCTQEKCLDCEIGHYLLKTD
jgi:hypothetical protein